MLLKESIKFLSTQKCVNKRCFVVKSFLCSNSQWIINSIHWNKFPTSLVTKKKTNVQKFKTNMHDYSFTILTNNSSNVSKKRLCSWIKVKPLRWESSRTKACEICLTKKVFKKKCQLLNMAFVLKKDIFSSYFSRIFFITNCNMFWLRWWSHNERTSRFLK